MLNNTPVVIGVKVFVLRWIVVNRKDSGFAT